VVTARRIIVSGCVGIVLFDAVWAFTADILDFDYGALWPISLAIYALVGFGAANNSGSIRMGVLGGAAVALTEATLGWAVSWAIGPGAPDAQDREAAILVGTALLVCATGAALGFFAGLFARRAAPSE
jgi:hypothetical protein